MDEDARKDRVLDHIGGTAGVKSVSIVHA
jgi:hypothetical protein